MKRGGQVGAELHGQCDTDFSGQVGGIIQPASQSVFQHEGLFLNHYPL